MSLGMAHWTAPTMRWPAQNVPDNKADVRARRKMYYLAAANDAKEAARRNLAALMK